MNALWIGRMAEYKNSPQALESAKRLIAFKVERKNILLRRYHRNGSGLDIARAKSLQDILLFEARAGKQFWREFRGLAPAHFGFASREPHAEDTLNRLLDIGYHHLTAIVRKLLDRHDVSPALALLHVARASDSAPLAYDLVELFRADIVDAEVLRFVRLKKKPILQIDQDAIAHFLHEVNERLEKKHYLKEFKGCQTYRYYMELQVLKFMYAVNHKAVFQPLYLPARHDGRCRLTGCEGNAIIAPEVF